MRFTGVFETASFVVCGIALLFGLAGFVYSLRKPPDHFEEGDRGFGE
jgi:uncharacterized protein involved in exopolysaccharide biosynthesis